MRQPVIPSRLKIGVDVPWVTSWTEEAQGGVGPCPTVDGQLAALQQWKPGQGKPAYSRNHLRRQRDSVRAMLCPMCGEATPEGDRWSQTGKFLAAGLLRARGFAQALPADLDDDRVVLDCGAIAPLHFRCAQASLQRCPHLGAMPDKDLKAFPPSWVVVPLYIEARQPVTGKALPAVSFLQLVGLTITRDPDWRNGLPRV
ncbi:MAG: hypothetical protein KKE02_15085 [Alphaproteobacteria bacterium]|nr:hypothetical protein [Alphaproteobacteria bacterium]MBU1516185.1 hypothetical protein [Alphaproteobacteria bacterium]MBU2093495.1 hypothetical protein [Alphaproteobacteria bacterium]MBU2152343.1 hypothetical protein [Alphaproteobacteria bacterium]MBU2308157.1 hypothetical protein [Alphaproteobacteria bacterium]